MDKDFLEKFADLKEDEVLETVHKEVNKGTDPREIFKACQEGMIIVGERFEKGVYHVSEGYGASIS